MKRLGYVRVSTVEQNPESQIRELQSHQVEKIFEDRVSGKSIERPQLKSLMEYAREEDEIYVYCLDRMARNLLDLRGLIDYFLSKGVSIRFLKEGLVFSPGKIDSISTLTLNLLGSFAEFERSLIRERQIEGIKIARQSGKYKGRKPSLNAEQLKNIKEKLFLGITKKKVAEHFKISRATLYAYLEKDAKGLPIHL